MAVNRMRNLTPFLREWIDGATIQNIDASLEKSGDSVASDADDTATGFVWTLYDQVLRLLTKLLALIPRGSAAVSKRDLKILKRSCGRLFLWGDEFRDGKLESVLEESEDLKETIVESLTSIGRALISDLFISLEDLEPSPTSQEIQHQLKELSILLEKAKLITDNEDELLGSVDGQLTEGISHGQIIKSLNTSVKCLMDLLPSMENTLNHPYAADGGHDDNIVTTPVAFQVSGPAKTYVLNVYDRFAKADAHLVERLGEANWQRHVALRSALGQEGVMLDSTPGVQEVPKSLFVPISMFHDSGLGSSHARSSFAATVASHSSFVSSLAENETGGMRVPSTPKEVFGNIPFVCDICGHLLSRIKNRIDWKRHVFADLKPYICTFSNCKDELLMFPTRKLWEEHEFGQHRLDRTFKCSDCSASLDTLEELRMHFKKLHQTTFTNTQFKIVASSSEQRTPHAVDSEECPLCLCIPGKSRRNFVTHLGRHMEGIALAALPRESTSDSGADSDILTEPDLQSDYEEDSEGGIIVAEPGEEAHEPKNSSDIPARVMTSKRHHDAYGYTALARACDTGKIDPARKLLRESPEDLDFPDYAGNTPLQIASLHGHKEIVGMLLDAGCDIDCMNNVKDTPLIDAVENGHIEVVKLLLSAGVNPRKSNAKGDAPLDLVDDDHESAQEIREVLRNAEKGPILIGRNASTKKQSLKEGARSMPEPSSTGRKKHQKVNNSRKMLERKEDTIVSHPLGPLANQDEKIGEDSPARETTMVGVTTRALRKKLTGKTVA